MRGMKLSIEEAHRLGVLPDDMLHLLSSGKPKGRAVGKAGKVGKPSKGAQNPQAILYDAIRAEIPEAKEEVGDLVPGRKFRADIYLPTSRVVIEMDGFQFHRSKTAYQNDRKRQNLLVEQGYQVLRYFTGQVLDKVQLAVVVGEVKRVHTGRNGVSG